MSEIFVRLLFSIANRARPDISWIVFPLFFSFIAFPCAHVLFSSCQSSKPCFRIEHGLSIWESLKYSFISMGLLQMSTNLSIVWKIFVFRIEVTLWSFILYFSSYSSAFIFADIDILEINDRSILLFLGKFIHLDGDILHCDYQS